MAFTDIGSDEDIFTGVGTNSVTASVTIPTLDANSIGIVAVDVISGADRTISGITWNGDAMTAGPVTVSVGKRTQIWYRVNPDNNLTGDIIVTFSANLVSGGVSVVTIWANADATVSADDTDNAETGTAASPDIVSTQAGANELVISTSFSAANAISATSTTGCTELQSWDQGGNCTITAYSIPTGSGNCQYY